MGIIVTSHYVEKDLKEALGYYRKAEGSNLSKSIANYNIGYMMLLGEGVENNIEDSDTFFYLSQTFNKWSFIPEYIVKLRNASSLSNSYKLEIIKDSLQPNTLERIILVASFVLIVYILVSIELKKINIDIL